VLQVQQNTKKSTSDLLSSPEKSPTRIYNTRSSPRSAEKRPHLAVTKVAEENSSAVKESRDSDSILHSTQQSLSGRMDEIQLESPSKKINRQLWRADSPEEKLADDSVMSHMNQLDTR